MSCSRCTSTPQIHKGTCMVYLNCDVGELFSKAKEVVKNHYKILKEEKKYLQFKVPDFQDFIKKLSLDKSLSSLEERELYILPLGEGEDLDFNYFSNTKSLHRWISIIDSQELIYILEHNSILTFFQPIVDVRNKSIYGYELLSRGMQKNGEIMPPFQMLTLAKESQLSFNLDRQFREMCITNAAKKKIDKKLFINFLPTVVYNPSVCLKTTIDLIDKYSLDPKQITFEVVETEEIADTDHLINILDFYRDKGFSIALDDIGSGYSSLNNLIKLKPDYIKIDMEIIRNIHKDNLKQAIFKSLISMVDNREILALAEGVETLEELEYVIKNGVDLVQGYYFGRPCEEPLSHIELDKCIINTI